MDLFREQAAKCPDTLAVQDSFCQFTYAQLDLLSDRLASWLSRKGFQNDSLIGLFAPRAARTIIAVFGILKARCAYVPLDINAPLGRAETIIAQICGRKLVLVGEGTPDFKLEREDLDIVMLSDIFEEFDRSDIITDKGVEVTSGPSPTNLSHIFFTSGPTGRPKGVMTEHRNVVRLIWQDDLRSRIKLGMKMAHIANIASDMSTTEIWAPLLNGGTLVCIDTLTTLDTAHLYKAILEQNIRFVRFTPTLLHQCLIEYPAMFDLLDFLLIGGDRLDPKDARKLMTSTRAAAFNIYGPTETTGFVAWYRIGKDDVFPNGVPLGRCVDNAGIFVMDLQQRPVPDGILGELVIVGDGLARSFLDSEQNAGRFVNIRLGDRLIRAYRSGDCVRRRASDGQVEFFGRIDYQVKIRGHRVELGEIEHVLSEHASVDEVVVVLVNGVDSSNQRLTAFVTLVPDDDPGLASQQYRNGGAQSKQKQSTSGGELRSYLQNQLPAHMVPSEIRILEKMPINANRKVDRQALTQWASEPTKINQVPNSDSTPRNFVERGVCEEFTAILGSPVSLKDNFSDLGGHSLMATMLISRIAKRFAAQVSVKDLFDHPTISSLSRHILPDIGLSTYSPISNSIHHGPVEQSFAQRRLWFMEQLSPESTRYLLPFAWHLRGPLNISALQIAFRALTKRHETLRTIFEQGEDGEFQVVLPDPIHDFEVIQISSQESVGREKFLESEYEEPFDLEASPGLRIALFRIDPEHHVLSVVMHHIIADDWSIDVLRTEISSFYAEACSGRDPLVQTPALPIQYRDFALWEKEPEQLAQQEKHLRFWVEYLRGSQPAVFPYDKPRPAELSQKTDKVNVTIKGAMFKDLENLCRTQQTTMFVVLLSAFRIVHFRLTNMDDATIGILNSCRDRQELEGLIGFSVNLQCIRANVNAGESFRTLLQSVQTSTATAFLNQDVPFERIVDALAPAGRDGSENPLVQTVFTFHPRSDSGLMPLQGLEVSQIDTPRQIKFDLEFHLYMTKNGIQGNMYFSEDLFYRETIEKVVDYFYETLASSIANDCHVRPKVS